MKTKNQNNSPSLFDTTQLSFFAKGIMWALLAWSINVLNNLSTKLLSQNLPTFEIVFFRFAFCALFILPFLLKNKHLLKISKPSHHFIRAILGFITITSWTYIVARIPLSLASTISFSVPLCVIPFSILFLKERVKITIWIAALIGFGGVFIASNPVISITNDLSFLFILVPVFAVSLSDVTGKYLISKDNKYSIVFYYSLFVSLMCLPTIYSWTIPSLETLFVLFLLGVGASLVHLFFLKACQFTDVSTHTLCRYIELPVSVFFGYIIFQEIPSLSTLEGAFIIILTTLFVLKFGQSKFPQKPKETNVENPTH